LKDAQNTTAVYNDLITTMPTLSSNIHHLIMHRTIGLMGYIGLSDTDYRTDRVMDK